MLITIPEDPSIATNREQYHQPVIHSLSAPVQRATYETSVSRLRVIHLYRPQCGSYGFHLRGGREHETGFFISHVESGSEAYAQGLRTGDQLVRVNNMNVNHSLHNEVASIVKHSSEVLLEVKSAGIVPVKNNQNDQLSWMVVSNNNHQRTISSDSQPTSLKSISSTSSGSSISLSSSLFYINMKGAGERTIGCSICKGPEDKPGIFVQKIHVGGIADEAGLRAGDKIFSCNGKSFLNIEFQEAVYHMKSCQSLKLEVLRGAGMDLITGESSGYNSSISSEGDETSENECAKERCFQKSKAIVGNKKRLVTRVNSLYLDSNRDWEEIEAEWAEAEVSEKRSQLAIYKNQEPKIFSSKSLWNLSPSQENKTGLPKPSTVFKTKIERQSAPMHRPLSMTNVSLLKNKDNFKIAFHTSDDPHINKIIIPPPPKDEKNAIMRLDLLSASPILKKTVSLPITTTADHHYSSPSVIYSSGSDYSGKEDNISRKLVNIQSMKSQTLKMMPKGLKLENRTINATRLNRGRLPPKECTAIHADDCDSNYSCSRICIASGNGKFTSKVIIRSCPPTPPPRATSTRLTYERHQCSHRRRLNSQQLSDSPPSSISSGSSHEYPKCDHNFNRQTSSGSLSLSSDESGTWEENQHPFVVNYSSIKPKRILSPPKNDSTLPRVVPAIKSNPPPPPPPPPVFKNSSTILSPPIPPPPPLPSLSTKPSNETNSTSTNLSLSAALSNEIKARLEQDSNGLKDIRNSKLEHHRRSLPDDPKKQQHEKLMEEFKRAHAQMFIKRNKETCEHRDVTETDNTCRDM